ncbi:MAG TPA: YibE/F family protein [Jiangellaceae bacterium]
MGTDHGHHGGELTITPHVRHVVLAVLVPLVLATIAGIVLLWPSGEHATIEGAERYNGTIQEIRECQDSPDPQCLEATVRVESGPDDGAEVIVAVPYGPGVPEFHVGDAVVMYGNQDWPIQDRYTIDDFQRSVPLALLAVLFAVAVVVLSRWRGVAALAGLALSVLVLTVFILPALLEGTTPLAVAVVGASAIMMVTLYLAHGFSMKTSVALIGTVVSLSLTGLLGYGFTHFANLVGLGDESISYLGAIATEVDLRGLLLAGLVIGALGVLDDVTVSQASTVWELARANPQAGRRYLFGAGLRVGRDHVAATVNTLVLAYAGASLPLLMLFTVADRPVLDVLTMELIAQEVVRALVGSIGIVAAVPVTTALAAITVREATRPTRARRTRGRRARRTAEVA